MISKFANEVTDEFKRIRGSKQIADIVNPLRIILCGLTTNFKFILQGAIRNDNTLFVKLGIYDFLALHNSIKRGQALLSINNDFFG